MWVPVGGWTQLTGEEQTQRKYRWLGLIGRLRQGDSRDQAEQELDVIRKQWEAVDSSLFKDVRFSLLAEFEARGEWSRTLDGLLVVPACRASLVDPADALRQE